MAKKPKQEWKEHSGKVLDYDDSSLPLVSFLYTRIATDDPDAPQTSTKDWKLNGKKTSYEELSKKFGRHQLERVVNGIK